MKAKKEKKKITLREYHKKRMVTGIAILVTEIFENTVEHYKLDKTADTKAAITQARQQAVRTVASQQATSIQTVKDQTASYIAEKETSAKTEIENYTSEKIAEINKKASEANTTLANTIADGTTLKTQLETTISTADTSKKNLDAFNTAAGKTKTALDSSNATATQTKSRLDSTNKTASDLNTSLGEKYATFMLHNIIFLLNRLINDY